MIWTLLGSSVGCWLIAEYAHHLAERTRNEADYTWSAPRRKALYRSAAKMNTAGRVAVCLLFVNLLWALVELFKIGGVL